MLANLFNSIAYPTDELVVSTSEVYMGESSYDGNINDDIRIVRIGLLVLHPSILIVNFIKESTRITRLELKYTLIYAAQFFYILWMMKCAEIVYWTQPPKF